MQNRTDNQVNAGFFVRLAAYLIDSLIVGAALLTVRIPFWISSWGTPDNILVRDLVFKYSFADIVIYVLGVLYFILLTYKTGSTIGKKALHLKVQSVEDRNMTLFEVAFRETVGRFLSSLAYVGYFMMAVSKSKRGLHDFLSDTEVVYYHEKKEHVDTPVVIVTASQDTQESKDAEYVVPTYTQEETENVAPVYIQEETGYILPTYTQE